MSPQDLAHGPVCPIPIDRYPVVTMAHGGGGRLSLQLVEQMFLEAFDNDWLRSRHDAAVLTTGHHVAFTTDSYVVHPRFFPGGDIGKLAVYGTVNDLAMAGAFPRYVSLALILEEGLPMDELWRVVCSLAGAAKEAEVHIVTGDTKVVERGKADGLFINTAGIGYVEHDHHIGPARVQPGDALLLSGDLGRHGMAIMAQREGLQFETPIESDCAPLHRAVQALLDEHIPVHCLRDLTRGGLTAACHEIASAAQLTLQLDEHALRVRDDVRGACEILGLDPMHIACEGRFLAVVPEAHAERALELLRHQPVASEATHLGHAREADPTAPVVLRTAFGLERPVDLPTGELLPRIC